MKTVIEMANLAGLEKISSGWRAWTKDLEQFADLVRADAIAEEREACAKLIEDYKYWLGRTAKEDIAAAIRARGLAK